MIYKFSQYGQYTLLTYVASLVLFGVMCKYIPINIEGCGLLELLSFVLCPLCNYLHCLYLFAKNCIQKQIYKSIAFRN